MNIENNSSAMTMVIDNKFMIKHYFHRVHLQTVTLSYLRWIVKARKKSNSLKAGFRSDGINPLGFQEKDSLQPKADPPMATDDVRMTGP